MKVFHAFLLLSCFAISTTWAQNPVAGFTLIDADTDQPVAGFDPVPDRVPNTTLNLPADLPAGSFSTENAFPGLTFGDPVAIVSAPGETNRLFVVEQIGRIAVIPDLSNPTKEIFLDMQSLVRANGNEEGLLGLAFHPNFNRVGEPGYETFFVFYQATISNNRHWRLSRGTVSSGNPNRGDLASLTPMITQRDEAGNHNGGDLHFGDDGYLYVSVGDEGAANDNYDNGQHIDKDFFAAILRIDVDLRGENLVPNSHASVHAGTYKIPADNPYVGATSFNGSSVSPSSVRTEIWAIGLRNPWRMSFDRPTGRLFVADVGQGAREEINILSPSVFAGNEGNPNYGWSYREGFLAFTNGPGGATPPAGFSAIDPIHDYPRSQGQSVTGGLVYRGTQYPELAGDYLFADYVSGRIWAMDDPGGASQAVTQITTDNQIAGFGVNPGNGDILLADDNSNRQVDDVVKRLLRSSVGGGQPPPLLSQTGAFSNLATLTTEDGIIPYDINTPFWSDKAEKTRWFSIPDGTSAMTWSQDGNWSFPTGQIWIKHFELDLDRDNPGTNVRRLETRFLVKTDEEVYGITYRWNDLQTDAELVDEAGLAEDFTIREGGQDIVQTWEYPSRANCMTCHTPVAGYALGFSTRQLNKNFSNGLGTGNQIASLENAGYFSNDPPDPSTLPRYYSAEDETASLTDRVRSFLGSNCVQCHQDGGPALGSWSARPEIPLENAGIINGPLVNNDGDSENRIVVAGSPSKSMLLQRLDAVGDHSGLPAMPPVGTSVKNQEAIDLLTAWINRRILFVRGGDRSGGFLEAGNDTSRTEHLGDINNTSNSGGNHGWAELAETLRNQGIIVEQITEGSETPSGPADGIPIDFTAVDLDQYSALVFGSNNAVYDTASIDAVDAWIRGGGAALFISDANFGGDWADASNSDQQFLDRFGLVMNQDRGTYLLTRSNGEFLEPDHEILAGVNTFDGEGVTPITVGSLPADVDVTILATAEGQVRRNAPPFGGDNQGPSSAATAMDAALVVATAGQGKIAGHFDRNTFFNQGGAGTDITRFENRQFAINLFEWLSSFPIGPGVIGPPTGLAIDTTSSAQVTLLWQAVANADSYEVLRSESSDWLAAVSVGETGELTLDDTAATPGVLYHWFVRAIMDGNSGPVSASITDRRIFPPSGNMTVSSDRTDGIQMNWMPVPGAVEDYEVRKSLTTNFGGSALLGLSGGAVTLFDSSVAIGTTFYYWVRAVSDEVSGDWIGPVGGMRRQINFSEYTGQHGLSGTDALAGADSNGDGIVNLIAATADLSPTASSPQPSPIVSVDVDFDAATATVIYRRIQGGLSGATYQLMQSTNLVDWSPVDGEAPGNLQTLLPANPDGDGSAEWIQVEISNVPTDGGIFFLMEASME